MNYVPAWMLALDARLLVLFERFAQWFQRTVGPTCFQLAKWCMWGAFVLHFVAEFIDMVMTGEVPVAWHLFLASAIMLIAASVFHWYCNRFERIIFSNPTTDNELKIDPETRSCRIAVTLYFLAVLILHGLGTMNDEVTLSSVPEMMLVALIMCSFYLISCRPLPPGKSKVRKWLERMRVRFTTKPHEGALPA